MKVAVTGATGVVGSHLAEALRQRGHEVVCLVRTPDRAKLLLAMGCRLVRGDLENGDALRDLVAGTEVVHHVAGAVTAAGGGDAAFIRVNREGTERVAAAAKSAGVGRLV